MLKGADRKAFKHQPGIVMEAMSEARSPLNVTLKRVTKYGGLKNNQTYVDKVPTRSPRSPLRTRRNKNFSTGTSQHAHWCVQSIATQTNTPTLINTTSTVLSPLAQRLYLRLCLSYMLAGDPKNVLMKTK